MQDFLDRTADQARRRAQALPEGAEQHVQIDLRGHEVSETTLESNKTDLEAMTEAHI